MDSSFYVPPKSYKAENIKPKTSKPNATNVLCSMDFSQLLDDEVFIFLVGPSRRVFRIHKSALKRISEPLTYMMSNGKMKESIEGQAVLDDIDPDAFASLAKFAYLGICGAIRQSISAESYPTAYHSSVTNAFRSKRYPINSMSDEALYYLFEQPAPLATLKSRRLVEHAHLYCLANRYLVPELPAICLHVLHRDLVAFAITTESVEELADLLSYTYTHTSDHGDILDGSCDSLRSLVMSYVIDTGSSLMSYKGFRDLLSAGGGHTADFMALTFAGKFKVK